MKSRNMNIYFERILNAPENIINIDIGNKCQIW